MLRSNWCDAGWYIRFLKEVPGVFSLVKGCLIKKLFNPVRFLNIIVGKVSDKKIGTELLQIHFIDTIPLRYNTAQKTISYNFKDITKSKNTGNFLTVFYDNGLMNAHYILV